MKIRKTSYLFWILNTEVKSVLMGIPDYKSTRPGCVPRIYCRDGENVSIQAGEYLYCSPRTNYPVWDKIEAGFPSCTPPIEWKEYSDQWNISIAERLNRFGRDIRFAIEADVKYGKEGNKLQKFLKGFKRGIKREIVTLFAKQPCNTIYAYMPVSLVELFIKQHGGENTKKCFEELKKYKNRQ
jgi:hypothetical protein